MLDALIVEPLQTADSAVIWLHGLGASQTDFEPVAQMLQPKLRSTRFILPQAPTQPVTVNGGYAMPSWYDILEMSANKRAINQQQLEQSAEGVMQLDRKSTRLNSSHAAGLISYARLLLRSEERRVGKECRSRWSPYH